MRDILHAMTAIIVCPGCNSEKIETIPSEGVPGVPEYYCLSCGNRFNASGSSPLADSDDLHAP